MTESSSPNSSIFTRMILAATFVFFSTSSCLGGYFLSGQTAQVDENNLLQLPKGPYQQYIAPGEVLIGAQLPDGQTGTVRYWQVDDEHTVVTVPFKKTWDRISMVRLTDLIPTKSYKFIVQSGEFFTSAHPLITGIDDGESFKFLVIGDTKPDCEDVHPELVEQMAHVDASFYIHLGDFVRQGDRSEDWDIFFDLHRPLMNRMPLLPVVGNHDTSPAGYFTGLFLLDQRGPVPTRYYKTEFGNTLLIVLDTRAPIATGDAQYLFLQEALESSKHSSIENVFISLHEPFYSSGKHGSTKGLTSSILPLIERYEVAAIFSGHDHHYERSKKINGIVHIVSGGGGAHLSPVDQMSSCEKALLTYHFLEVTVDGGNVLLRAINLHGQVIDETRLK